MAFASYSSLAASRLSMWEQDRLNSFSDRIASRCPLPDVSYPALARRPLYPVPEEEEKEEGEEEYSKSETAPSTMPPLTSVPSLSSDIASATASSSTSSIDTRLASELAGHDILEDHGDGVLVVPSHHSHHSQHYHNNYQCLFHVLDCHNIFDDSEQWRTHVLSHFRTHEPPQFARCPLCPRERFQDSPYRRAWDLLLDHVDMVHYQQGHTLAGSRPDFELMQYLYRLRIISVDQFKVMQLPPPPTSPAYHQSQETIRASIGSSDEPYCSPYSRRREQRVRGQRRGVSVA